MSVDDNETRLEIKRLNNIIKSMSSRLNYAMITFPKPIDACEAILK